MITDIEIIYSSRDSSYKPLSNYQHSLKINASGELLFCDYVEPNGLFRVNAGVLSNEDIQHLSDLANQGNIFALNNSYLDSRNDGIARQITFRAYYNLKSKTIDLSSNFDRNPEILKEIINISLSHADNSQNIYSPAELKPDEFRIIYYIHHSWSLRKTFTRIIRDNNDEANKSDIDSLKQLIDDPDFFSLDDTYKSRPGEAFCDTPIMSLIYEKYDTEKIICIYIPVEYLPERLSKIIYKIWAMDNIKIS